MKTVLIITYYWPPSGGAGVQRWLKFSKYLPEFGWQPIILTVDPEYASYPQKDYGLLNEIPPDLEIIYTRASTGIFSAYKKISGKKEIPYGGFANESNPGLLEKILRFIRGNFFLPDSRIGWNRYALKRAIELINERNIKIVITTSPPHSTQLTGLKIKKETGIKWIADLRDPWADIYYADQMYQTPLARRINAFMESQILNAADRVIATCNSTRNLFRSKLMPDQLHDKIITLTNGFDPDDFNLNHLAPEKFIITYLGTFAKNYDIKVLIDAIALVSPGLQTGITIRFIGKIDSSIVYKLKENPTVSVEIVPYVEHRIALDFLARSSVLLLVIPSKNKADEMIPGKLFEYMASRKPIIAIGPKDSDVAEILKITKSGEIFEKSDLKILAEHITQLVSNYENGIFENDPVSLEQYSRRDLSKKIADLIKMI